MDLTKDYNLAIVPRFLNLLVVPEKKKTLLVFSFRPIGSIVFWNLKMYYFITYWPIYSGLFYRVNSEFSWLM